MYYLGKHIHRIYDNCSGPLTSFTNKVFYTYTTLYYAILYFAFK